MFWDNLLIVTVFLILLVGLLVVAEWTKDKIENAEWNAIKKRNQKERKRIGLS